MSQDRVTITGRPTVTNIPPNSAGAAGAPPWVKWIFVIYGGAAVLIAAVLYWFL
jgi:hypothetical protein